MGVGELASGVAETLEENVRRDIIKEMRSTISEPEHRFFLALLMNVLNREDLLALVAQRFPDEPPVETVLRWTMEMAEVTEDSMAILDAAFPETLETDIDDQANVFLGALRHFMTGAKKVPTVLKKLSAEELQHLRDTFAHSSLNILVA